MSRIVNSKKSNDKVFKTVGNKKLGFKDYIVETLKGIFSSKTITAAAKKIWDTLIMEKNYDDCQQWLVTNIAFDQEIAASCQQKLATITVESEKRAAAIEADRRYKTNPMVVFNNM